jgi:predicted membrane protein
MPAVAADLRARSTMASVMSTPMACPLDPVRFAASNRSMPAPQPTSSTVSPAWTIAFEPVVQTSILKTLHVIVAVFLLACVIYDVVWLARRRSERHPIPAARAININPAPTTTNPLALATCSPQPLHAGS